MVLDFAAIQLSLHIKVVGLRRVILYSSEGLSAPYNLREVLCRPNVGHNLTRSKVAELLNLW